MAISAVNNLMKTSNLNIESLQSANSEKISFKSMLDSLMGGLLTEVSNTETENNYLVEQFVQKKCSPDELLISTNQLTLELSLATTVINTGVQTFKEIISMQV